MAERKTAATADAVIADTPGYYYGYTVTTVTATAAILLYDNATTNSGTVVDVIPIGTAAGTSKIFAEPIRLNNGLYAKFATGTGTVLFLFD